jgi:hypothetical protein
VESNSSQQRLWLALKKRQNVNFHQRVGLATKNDDEVGSLKLLPLGVKENTQQAMNMSEPS